MTHTQSKNKEMKRYFRMLAILLIPVVALIIGAAAPELWAGNHDDGDEEEEIPFDEAHIFFELNDTDGDLGIHALIDGEAWKKLEIEDPNERRILNIRVRGRLARQGLTELFFESAEPPFESDEPGEETLSPERFFRRFPEGEYEIEGTTLDGEELESEVLLSHVMPAPPEPTVNGIPAAEDCDEVLPVVSAPVTIDWDPVMESHPELGKQGDVDIHNYEVVVEIDETPWKTSIILPPHVTEFVVPPEILSLSDEIKFEVLVREANYNQTAVESCFVIGVPAEEE